MEEEKSIAKMQTAADSISKFDVDNSYQLKPTRREIGFALTTADIPEILFWMLGRFFDWAADKALTQFLIMILNGLVR